MIEMDSFERLAGLSRLLDLRTGDITGAARGH
jgi:hypothetical protein